MWHNGSFLSLHVPSIRIKSRVYDKIKEEGRFKDGEYKTWESIIKKLMESIPNGTKWGWETLSLGRTSS